MIETGDPIEVVAKGFDLDEQLLTDILAGERRRCQRTLLRSCASGSDWRSRARETRLARSRLVARREIGVVERRDLGAIEASHERTYVGALEIQRPQ
ncbi:MAG: hypothetical protein ACFCVK_05420, partial [Acidimicrobiales bacterium]